MFKSENEIEKFNYDDCIISDFKIMEDKIVLILNSLIVCANNSQNSNYTDSYAGETRLCFEAGKIEAFLKEGYKYYDANDKLISEFKDENIEIDGFDFEKTFSKVFLIGISINEKNQYVLRVEMPEAEAVTVTDTYEIIISAVNVNFSWEKYMNRVQ